MSKRRKQYDGDDGRVIANMNVEGMPWHSGGNIPVADQEGGEEQPVLTREERRAYIGGAMKAVLLIGGVFLIACFLLLLFMDQLWLR